MRRLIAFFWRLVSASLDRLSRDKRARWSQRRKLRAGLNRAFQNGEIYAVYQPKLDLAKGRYDGVETLIRWHHPTLGEINPATLIETAEQSGQIHALSLWIFERAVRDQHMVAAQFGPLHFHVNISGESLGRDDFIARLCELAGGAAATLGVEITETAFISNPPAALANLLRLVAVGIKISIDDYGTGHSSLAYLKDLPADELKIDKLFVSGMTRSNRDPLIVRSTIDLAHALGMRVVAEGVESPATLALLRAMGCDVAQGYHISPALKFDDLVDFLANEDHLRQLNESKVSLTPSRTFWTRAEREQGSGAARVTP